MSYRDRAFCLAKDCMLFSECDRTLTKSVISQAEKWWGGPDAPILVVDRLDCYKPPVTGDQNLDFATLLKEIYDE
jgi:hypothetical protein